MPFVNGPVIHFDEMFPLLMKETVTALNLQSSPQISENTVRESALESFSPGHSPSRFTTLTLSTMAPYHPNPRSLGPEFLENDAHSSELFSFSQGFKSPERISDTFKWLFVDDIEDDTSSINNDALVLNTKAWRSSWMPMMQQNLEPYQHSSTLTTRVLIIPCENHILAFIQDVGTGKLDSILITNNGSTILFTNTENMNAILHCHPNHHTHGTKTNSNIRMIENSQDNVSEIISSTAPPVFEHSQQSVTPTPDVLINLFEKPILIKTPHIRIHDVNVDSILIHSHITASILKKSIEHLSGPNNNLVIDDNEDIDSEMVSPYAAPVLENDQQLIVSTTNEEPLLLNFLMMSNNTLTYFNPQSIIQESDGTHNPYLATMSCMLKLMYTKSTPSSDTTITDIDEWESEEEEEKAENSSGVISFKSDQTQGILYESLRKSLIENSLSLKIMDRGNTNSFHMKDIDTSGMFQQLQNQTHINNTGLPIFGSIPISQIHQSNPTQQKKNEDRTDPLQPTLR